MKWTDTCRYGTLREYEYSEETHRITMTCHHVVYYSFSLKTGTEHVVSIDPDGGPNLGIGGTITHGEKKITIRDIVSHTHNRKKKRLVIVLDVAEEV